MKKLFIVVLAVAGLMSCSADEFEYNDTLVKEVTDTIPAKVLEYYHTTWEFLKANECDSAGYVELYEPTVKEAKEYLQWVCNTYEDMMQDIPLFSDDDWAVALWIGFKKYYIEEDDCYEVVFK